MVSSENSNIKHWKDLTFSHLNSHIGFPGHIDITDDTEVIDA